MKALEDRKVAILCDMAVLHEKIKYNTFLVNLNKRPEDVKAYLKRLSDMALEATAKIDSSPVAGDDLIARVAEVKATRAIVRNLLSDLNNSETNLQTLAGQYKKAQEDLKGLETPKKKTQTNYRMPK